MLIEDIKAARCAQGLSRAALAERIGVDPQVIKRLEGGIGTMPTLLSVMRVLNYHLSGLARGPDLPTQLRQRRLNRGWSQEQVAARAGLSRGTVAALESGKGSVRCAIRLLEAIAPKARRHEPQRPHYSHDPKGDRDHHFTPPEFMEAIYDAFGPVDFDPCGHIASPVIAGKRLLKSEGDDGLADPWSGRLAYVNPPYSALLRWLRRADEQWEAGNVQTVVCLVPARTDSAWFHDRLRKVADIYLLQGRLRFLTLEGQRRYQAPFPLMVVMFGASPEQRARFATLVPGFWLNA